ncbi:MAG TPA: DinB family protein [Candidatus Dormibacteraeota bacterium]
MGTVELRERLAAARERLRRIPATGPGEYGAPDPDTGERWNRGNVLGHVAEMLPFWTGQVQAAAAGAEVLGRGEAGYAERKDGIAKGTVVPEMELRAEIDVAAAALDAVLAGLAPEALGRRVTYRRASGDKELTLEAFLDHNLVGHFEQHLEQLDELS